MLNLKVKDICIFCLCIMILVLAYLNFNNKPLEYPDAELQNEIARLEGENSIYLNRVLQQEQEIILKAKRIDSLESLKPKIIETYKYINNEINKANCRQLITKFDSIFSNANLK